MLQIISSYTSVFIMIFTVFFFANIILKDENLINKWGIFLVILGISIPQTLIFLNFDGTMKTILMAIINIIFYRNLFDIDYKKAIFITFLYMIIVLIPDLLELFIATYILGVSKRFYYENFAGGIFGNLITCFLMLIISYLLKDSLKKLIHTEINNSKKIILLSVATFICIGLFFYTIIKEFRFSNDIFAYLLAIGILVYSLFSLIMQTIDHNKTTKEYDQLLEVVSVFEEEVEKQRIQRHEIKNEILAIRAKICDKEKENKIVKYIDDILGEDYTIEHEQYAKFVYLPANGIKGLCYFKAHGAEKKGINVAVNISKRIENSTIFDLDLKKQREFAKILGVFMDNAIEASLESEEKQLGIEAYANDQKEFRIIISNTFSNKIDEEKLGKESFSTKGKGRGHGLLLVKQIMNNNQSFETRRQVQNHIYSQTIIVKKK